MLSLFAALSRKDILLSAALIASGLYLLAFFAMLVLDAARKLCTILEWRRRGLVPNLLRENRLLKQKLADAEGQRNAA